MTALNWICPGAGTASSPFSSLLQEKHVDEPSPPRNNSPLTPCKASFSVMR